MIEISINNDLYPENLRKIENPPKKLYVLGNENILNEKNISIIGSRDCSENGAQIAKEFAKELSNNGICIVSGMARGIDSMAHLGALEATGKTIAVLGSGFNYIFPSKVVFNEIIKKGGTVITEYEPNTEVFPQGFRDRNRIVSGLSEGILIIEAKEKSGTGITAEFAKKQGKKVFCIAHGIEDKRGIGTNRLIKRGAILVTSVQDITDNLNVEYKQTVEKIEVPVEYLKIYKHIDSEPITADELHKKTKISISEINYILTMLELEGHITSLPGQKFKGGR